MHYELKVGKTVIWGGGTIHCLPQRLKSTFLEIFREEGDRRGPGVKNRAVCGPAIFGGPQPTRANFWVARIGPHLKFCKILSKFRKIRPK